MVPVKDEEDGLQYLIQDLDRSGIREEYDISFLFVIDERTSDNSRDFAARMSEQIVDQRGSHGKGDAIKRAINNLEGSKLDFVVFLNMLVSMELQCYMCQQHRVKVSQF